MAEQGFSNIEYGPFGISTFEREIRAALGADFWDELTAGLEMPDIDGECRCGCRNMKAFMDRLEARVEPELLKAILVRVRHGLSVSQCAWAREQFLERGDLDGYLTWNRKNELERFVQMNREGKDFYGQNITDEVLEFVRQHPAMLGPVRSGNRLLCMAFPANMERYLSAGDERMKRYHACHCPFAKESILSDAPVSAALCNCSLGHVMNFTEAFLGRKLEGRVLTSVLNGDLTCTYEIELPEDVMEAHVYRSEADVVVSNYGRYFSSFAESGVVEDHRGDVDYIVPKAGCRGPALVYSVHLDSEAELRALLPDVRAGRIPGKWLITPHSALAGAVAMLEANGFRNLSAGADEPEPAMLLNRGDFRPAVAPNSGVTCREIRSKADFRVWIDIVNGALHGWDMIDADHYYRWVEDGSYRFYLGEIDGVPVTTAATLSNGGVASLEFVSTLAECRRRGVASAVCSRAIADLLAGGAKAVTLSACGESASLYRSLGFHRCFDNVIMSYEV
ncbi:MAG: GNAT family N-acetyltransferase [Clostridia bacterium]|nr:GNAT family N-acetyltransferase [Clostridia bacterium]